MIRRVLTSANNLKVLTHTNRAGLFNQSNFDPKKDYYLTLGVSKDANEADIKKAYYKLAMQYHPDHAKGQDAKFKEINQAYECLSDAQKRKQYDSMRTFGNFTKNFGQKAQQGSYHYQDYSSVYQNMSFQQQEQVRQRMQVLLRRMVLYSIGIVVLWNLLTRRPNPAYQEMNGQLIPMSPEQVYNGFMAAPQHSGYAYGSPYSQGQQYNYNLNPNPQPAAYQAQYYPTRSANQPPPGHFQSNYAPQ